MSTPNLRQHRLALVKELNLKQHFQRSHTSTGVWRRADLTEESENKQRRNMSNSSLANLQRRRATAQ